MQYVLKDELVKSCGNYNYCKDQLHELNIKNLQYILKPNVKDYATHRFEQNMSIIYKVIEIKTIALIRSSNCIPQHPVDFMRN